MWTKAVSSSPRAAAITRDQIHVGTDFGPDSLTTSGYPRVSKIWTRGTPLSEAKTLFEGRPEDVSVYGFTLMTPQGNYDFAIRSKTFFRREYHYVHQGELKKLDFPEDARFEEVFRKQVVLRLESAVLDRMFGGESRAMDEAMAGNLSFQGDAAKAMTLQTLEADLIRLYSAARG